jgi:acyl-CoA reductase-like NAD-dependent aldehyde dehydrogenase
MTTTADAPAATEKAGAQTFDSLDPATGEVVATFPIHSADEVKAAV